MSKPFNSSLKANRPHQKKVKLPNLEFYKQPKEILLKVIDILEKQHKAVRIEIGSDIGVKFLQ